MLTSVDGKISTGSTDNLDTDTDFRKIKGIKEGLQQYYDIEKKTDLHSLNSGRVMAKIGINKNDKLFSGLDMVSFIVIDNSNLKLIREKKNYFQDKFADLDQFYQFLGDIQKSGVNLGRETSTYIKRRYINEKLRKAVWDRDGAKCVKCGSTTNLGFDHIIPIRKGGKNNLKNLRILCGTCNKSKKNELQKREES